MCDYMYFFFTICNGKIRKFLDVSYDESFDSFVKPCPGLKPPVELSDKASYKVNHNFVLINM